MFCTNCGKQIPDHVKFCTSCGTKIERAAETPVTQDATPVEVVSGGSPRKKNTKLPMILVIILAVILMAACIFALSKLVSELDFGGSTISVEQLDPKEDEEEVFEENAEEVPAETAAAEESDSQEKEALLAEAAMLVDMGDVQGALVLLEIAQEAYGDDPAFQEAYDLYQSLLETEPVVLTTADLVSHESISGLIDTAMLQREKADAKWDHKNEIPGDCEYKGYIYMDDPENPDNNKLYLIFMMNATIKNVPIQFIYWVYFDDIAFDDQGVISYSAMGTSNNDGYTVKTAFGSYYSYYGLDNYEMFFEKIISKNGLEVVEENVGDVAIKHPVSDTFK